jgi:hypothetical protein
MTLVCPAALDQITAESGWSWFDPARPGKGRQGSWVEQRAGPTHRPGRA